MIIYNRCLYFKTVSSFTDVRKSTKILDNDTIHQRKILSNTIPRVLLSRDVVLVKQLDNNVCQFVDTINDLKITSTASSPLGEP